MTTNYADVVSLPDQKHNLQLGKDAGGPRYFLDGLPVHCGTALEMLVNPDTWILGRYETAWSREGGIQPIFCMLLPAHEGSVHGSFVEIALPPSACLRWP